MYELRMGLDGGEMEEMEEMEEMDWIYMGGYMDLKEGESELMIEIGEGQLDSAVGIFRSGGFEVFRSV